MYHLLSDLLNMQTYFILMMTKELFIELHPSRTEVLVSQHGHISHIVEVRIFLLSWHKSGKPC